MPRHHGLVIVRFHGGFLDGRSLRSDQPLTGGIEDYWHPGMLYDVTAGEIGASMAGVNPEGLESIRRDHSTPTKSLLHFYRVTDSQLQDSVLTLDVHYESVID